MTEAWESVRKRFNSSLYEIRASIWNSRHFEPKKFMDVVPEEVDIPTAIPFARQAILALKGNTSLQCESHFNIYRQIQETGGECC